MRTGKTAEDKGHDCAARIIIIISTNRWLVLSFHINVIPHAVFHCHQYTSNYPLTISDTPLTLSQIGQLAISVRCGP